MSTFRSNKRDYRQILTTQGINRELWIWLRSHATLEEITVGEIINELIDWYKRDVTLRVTGPDLTSPYELQSDHQLSIRGVDRDLWQWLKAQSILEGRYLGDIVNALIYRYRTELLE